MVPSYTAEVVPFCSAIDIPTIPAVFVGYKWAEKLQREHRGPLRQIIADATCEFFGDLEYAREPGSRFDHERFGDLGVVHHSGRWKRCEDLFIGRHRNTGFKMIEAEKTTSGNSPTTFFNGLLIEIDVPVDFSGRVFMGRDSGVVVNALSGFFRGQFGKDARVKFDHAAFEEVYEVYASDHDEVYQLVTPSLCDAMVALANTYAETTAAFVDGVFLLAVPVAGDLFEAGSVESSVYDCEDDIHAFLRQVTVAHRIIDHLHGDHREAGEARTP